MSFHVRWLFSSILSHVLRTAEEASSLVGFLGCPHLETYLALDSCYHDRF